MGFGKPASFLAAIIFAVGATSGIICLAVSAAYWFVSSGGYGLGVTSGVLGFLVFSLMIFWMVWSNLNEFDPAFVIFLIVAILSGVFSFIAGCLGVFWFIYLLSAFQGFSLLWSVGAFPVLSTLFTLSFASCAFSSGSEARA